jgi:2',3'-cyclic-nucleotide 2'-phosphodiesterase (5'-nucleotidase family)
MNKKLQVVVLIASLCGLGLSSCAPKIPDEVEIVILSTTDIHGYFENLAKYSAFVKETKAAHKNVIVADAGDRFTGNPYNDHYKKKQLPIVDLLNHVGVDVMVIGNHEFDYGIEVLNERTEDTEGAVISANIKLEGSGLRGIKPYHIIEKDGIKIAFLGLTGVEKNTGRPAALAKHIVGIEFYDPIETAARYRHLKKKSHAFVALTHMGVDEDVVLADSVPELNLIIGGHSHTMLKQPRLQNNVVITQAERYARSVVKTTILFKKGVVSQIANEMVDLRAWDGGEDPVVVEKIQIFESDPFFKEPFAILRYEIPNAERITYMMTDAARTLPDVDFAVINQSAIRKDFLPEGPITYGDIFRMSPYNNLLLIVGLLPAEIRKFLEAGNCTVSPSGFAYTVRETSGGRTTVEKITLPNGEKLDENKTYNVAVDNFLFQRYLNSYAEHAYETGVFVVDNIVSYLQNNPNADYRNPRARVKYAK